jgi:carbon monoxide dehydrogenase subunit G
MHLKGEVAINAPRAKVWDFLTDPQQIALCAPGVEGIEVVEPDKRYRGAVSIGLGSVKARFAGDVEVLELEKPDRARLRAHGNSGGSVADVVSEMQLADGPGGATIVHWTADINVAGQLASLVSRLMDPVSQKLSDQFYAEARRRIEADEPTKA